MIAEYQRRVDNYLGPGAVTVDHIAELHDVGYLPLLIKAVPEGTVVPLRVPMLTIRNTVPEFFWLTNALETLMSSVMWHPCTSATTALEYRRVFERFAKETGVPLEFVLWQGHDFSFRGLTGPETAALSGAAHLLSFTGTDTVPAIDLLEKYYGADSDKELVGGSVPATEHSVMCMGLQDDEKVTFKRLLTETYPAGILSVVSDTWDFWKVMNVYLPELKAEIMARDGKLVVRPDSGDPVKIICGDSDANTPWERGGAIQVLWEIFGGKVNKTGFRELDPHIGLIYGEAITLQRQEEILSGLKDKGFASTNVVFGIGSYTYQYVTRDTYGFAIKSTFGATLSRGDLPIFKDPVTDSGLKKSAKGLLRVDRDDNGELIVLEDVSWQDEQGGELQVIFEDGLTCNRQSLKQIRARIEAQL
ncbi:hypothetical protein LCGC14_1723840 [marine sediment metagenome]|uniref:Nicotinamide phosphoribosyltransferase n=1 Tax=marine sediment metagenome TaxID=412755 RepID=A0A0F9JS49_9ZZZZ